MILPNLMQQKDALIEKIAAISSGDLSEQEKRRRLDSLNKEKEQLNSLIKLQQSQVNLLNEQFERAFLDMLWDEARFRLQCRADKEKRQTWFFGWFRYRPISSDLAFHSRQINRSQNESIDKYKEKLVACLNCENFGENQLFADAKNILYYLGENVSKAADVVQAVQTCSSIKDPVLKSRRDTLFHLTQVREAELAEQFALQNKIAAEEQAVGLNNPARPAEISEDAWKQLILAAQYPAMLNNDTVKNVLNSRDRGAPTPPIPIRNAVEQPAVTQIQAIVRPVAVRHLADTQSLWEKISHRIAFVYGYSITGGDTIPKNNFDELMAKVAETAGGWALFRPSEYETVRRLLQLAKDDPKTLDDATMVTVMRRIDRLNQLYKFKDDPTKQSAFAVMRNEFGQVRGAVKVLKDSLEQTKYKADLAQLNKSHRNNRRLIEAAVTVQNEAEANIVEEVHLNNKTRIELQSLVELSYQAQLSKVISSQTTLQDSLINSHNYPRYDELLQKLAAVSSSQSFYFVVHMISVALLRTKGEGYDYEQLHALLNHIFDRRYDATVFQTDEETEVVTFNETLTATLKTIGFGWMTGYLPEALTMPSDSTVVNTLKEALLGSGGLFPPVTDSHSLSMDVVSPSGSRNVSSETNSVDRSAVGTPSRIGIIFSSLRSPSRVNVTDEQGVLQEKEADQAAQVKYVSQFQEKTLKVEVVRFAKEIISHKQDYERVEKHLSYTIPNQRIAALDALLKWYQERRPHTYDVNNPQLHFLEQCKICQTALKDDGWLSGTEAPDAVLPLEHLVDINQADWVSSNSGKKLIERIKKLFPAKKIFSSKTAPSLNFLVSESSTSTQNSPIPPQSTSISSTDREWMKSTCKLAHGVCSASDALANEKAKEYLKKYPNADRNVLSIYTLWQVFPETDRGQKIFGKDRPIKKSDEDFRSEYKKMLIRFECALKRAETIPEHEITDLMPKIPNHPIYTEKAVIKQYTGDENSLRLLFIKTAEALAPSKPDLIKEIKENTIAYSGDNLSGVDLTAQPGSGALNYLDQQSPNVRSSTRLSGIAVSGTGRDSVDLRAIMNGTNEDGDQKNDSDDEEEEKVNVDVKRSSSGLNLFKRNTANSNQNIIDLKKSMSASNLFTPTKNISNPVSAASPIKSPSLFKRNLNDTWLLLSPPASQNASYTKLPVVEEENNMPQDSSNGYSSGFSVMFPKVRCESVRLAEEILGSPFASFDVGVVESITAKESEYLGKLYPHKKDIIIKLRCVLWWYAEHQVNNNDTAFKNQLERVRQDVVGILNSGHPKDGKITLTLSWNTSERERLCQVIQNQLQRAGIQAEILEPKSTTATPTKTGW